MNRIWLRSLARRATWSLLLLTGGVALAGPVELADSPLATMADGSVVRSNLMFVLDDSGSMNDNYLPDNAPTRNACFGSADRNLIFYDPARTYKVPKRFDNTDMPSASFGAAWKDGYNAASAITNLNNNNPDTPNIASILLSSSSGSETKVCGSRNQTACNVPDDRTNEVDNDDGTTTKTTVSVERVDAQGKICSKNTANSCALTTTTKTEIFSEGGRFLWAVRKSGAASGSCSVTDFDIVRANNASITTAQKQNYANWYAYYRTRMLAMRAGAGRAFAAIDDKRFRVGFSKISEHANGGADVGGFLNVRDYDAGTQKADFFTRLYSTSGTGYTPLRPALARAGRYFANRLSGQSDPMQYSCQRNYTILSTDGYWNQADIIPKRLNGTTDIGNTDAGSAIARPMRDEFNNGAGVSNSLADVAMYYHVTDLRTSNLSNCNVSFPSADGKATITQDVCGIQATETEPAKYETQVMTTFTVGLGLSGTLAYANKYETESSDYLALTQGDKVWPDPISNDAGERIDDLWHAAVNGGGTYYSANNSDDMAASLAHALGQIDKETGSSAAAATSSLTPTKGDDWLFIPLYDTKTWDGTVKAFKIDPATGKVENPETPLWSAAARIKGQSTRKILFNNGSNSLVEFTKDNLSSAGRLTPFENLCAAGAEKLTQCSTLSTDAKSNLTTDKLIGFLRGSDSYEQSASGAANQLFRNRTGPMGDIVNGAPVYVKKPPMNYGDGYADFASKNRQGVLYVGANDGMLHALKVSEDATGGTELWAYVPTKVMPNMHLLADTAYESKHRFFVDGAPVAADVHDGTKWRTILVGGLGKGGRGYYALDITDPAAPEALWEFDDTDLGYSYGNPIITKNKAGKWVVMFTSGYNNINPGNGKGYLYVLDALSGTLLNDDPKNKIEATAGDTGTPSNLGKINAWVDDDKLNVASRVYGGDMLGNVWRFDFDDNLGPAGKEAFLLAQTGASQWITTKPMLSEIIDGDYRHVVVSVATGRYLGLSDIGDKSLQSIYTFKDELNTSSLGNLRSNAGMVKQTLNAARTDLQDGATITWATQKGWYIDLSLSAGERVNVDPDQQLNQLIVAGNIPTPTVCSPGGTSWLYYLDIGSGKLLLSHSRDTLLAGFTNIVTSTGKLVTLGQGVDGVNLARPGAEVKSSVPGMLRRTSWRELMN